MEITVSLSREIPVYRLSGRLDVSTSPQLEERLEPLMSGEGRRVVLDCEDLRYVSSAGLRVFLSVLRHLQAHGGGVALSGLSGQVLELFELAGLVEMFPIEPSADLAAARLVA